MTMQNRLTVDKRSSLLCLFVGDGEKERFIPLATGGSKTRHLLSKKKGESESGVKQGPVKSRSPGVNLINPTFSTVTDVPVK